MACGGEKRVIGKRVRGQRRGEVIKVT